MTWYEMLLATLSILIWPALVVFIVWTFRPSAIERYERELDDE